MPKFTGKKKIIAEKTTHKVAEFNGDKDCEYCGGLGEVTDSYYDRDSHQWVDDGLKECICVAARKLPDTYGEHYE